MNLTKEDCNLPNCEVLVAGEFHPLDIVANDQQRRVSEIALDYVINFSVCFVGIFSNVLVIVVFARQGFKDSTSISMTTVTIWDLIKCLGGFVQRLAGPLILASPALAYSWTNVSLIACNYLVSFSCYVTSVLAAYVAVERCLCVIIPLKVKWLLTPKVALVICVTISVVVFGCFVVIFGIYDVFWVYNPKYGTDVAVYKYNSFSANNTALFGYYNMSGVLWPLVSLVVIVISTFIISYKLQKSSEFRNRGKSVKEMAGDSKLSRIDTAESGSTKYSKQTSISRRDRQVVKMLLVVIVIYIVNLFPRVAHYLGKYIVFDYYYLRRYHNLFAIMAYAVFVFDYVNGSVNLFVFYVMSSSFRETTKSLFRRRDAR